MNSSETGLIPAAAIDVLQMMRDAVVIPVIAIDHPDHAVPLARALVAGGITVLEITLRTVHGLQAIQDIAREVPDAIVGVGTLTHGHEIEQSRRAGARFGVSPGLTRELIDASRDCALPLLPGVMTPSEVMAARDAGFRQLKLFPAVPAGGIGMLSALSGPLPDMTFCPTGGIGISNARDFLALPNVACVGGSWLTPKALVQAGLWNEITALAKKAYELRIQNI